MNSDGFDELLSERSQRAEEPPPVTFLRELLELGFRIEKLSFRRDRDHFSLGEPIYFLVLNREGNKRLERIEWSPELETLLFEKAVQAENQEQEANRGAYLLIQALRAADRKWGKDYTDCVLHELLASLFRNTKDVQDLLAQVPSHKPYQGEGYVECLSYLRKCLGDYASRLMDALRYSQDDARGIFTRAVLQMFDERHHLTLSRLLFTGT
ncbi:hypothetical protein [Sorangium sp. So ce1024]|jgi:hypothetical protein|uniref:hypothetical protein n=1 Tax=Sorangium sp. So ce1024 TaxID=3133327 RepID=UPI003F04330E